MYDVGIVIPTYENITSDCNTTWLRLQIEKEIHTLLELNPKKGVRFKPDTFGRQDDLCLCTE